MELELRSPLAGWCLDLAAVPDPVFAGRTMGDGIAIEPTGDRLHAPCDATVLSIHHAGHAVALRATNGTELLLHLGIDTVALHGDGFEALAKPGDLVRAGDPLIRFDLDQVVRRASAATTPMIVTSPATVEWMHGGGAVAIGDAVLRVRSLAQATTAGRDGPVRRTRVAVRLSHGLHARPAARVAQAMRDLDAEAVLVSGSASASAASSVSLLGLSLGHGDEVEVEARGADAEIALDRIATILADDDRSAPAGARVPAAPAAPATAPSGSRLGVAASPGLAIGPAVWLSTALPPLPRAGQGGEIEAERLRGAIDIVLRRLDATRRGVGVDIAEAHAALLTDPELRASAVARIDAGAHAATAFHDAAEAQAAVLRRSPDARIAERADDLVDLGRGVARAALGLAQEAAFYDQGAILLADELLPSHLLTPAARALGGIALRRGGATSHVAILAAGLGVPMVVALGQALDDVVAGDTVALDGDAGAVLPRPEEPARAAFAARIDRQRAAEAAARAAGDRAATTRDGVAVAVHANLGSLADADAAMSQGAEGSGLLRTEFLFLDRAAPPDLAEQAGCYRAIADRLGDRPLTIRLLDVGGDKPADYLALPHEENPALGERGIRILLSRPHLLDVQLGAILEANDAGTIRVMLPMVADRAELAIVRARLAELATTYGVAPPPLGVMIETPAAALIAGVLAAEADFLSIGSNDLAQYTLAMDRGNPAVAAGADALHPAVLRLIDATCRGAARHGRPVGLCGGLAADPLAVPLLIGLGVRSLSVPPARIAATRAAVAMFDVATAEALAAAALDATDAAQVRARAAAALRTARGDAA